MAFGSQIGEIKGVKGPDPYLPHLMGHEGCATILEVGQGVKTVRPGDLVVLHWKKAMELNQTHLDINIKIQTKCRMDYNFQ